MPEFLKEEIFCPHATAAKKLGISTFLIAFEISNIQREHFHKHHTYENRMKDILNKINLF